MTFYYRVDPVNSLKQIDEFPEKKKTVTRKLRKDRRKRKEDRRSSVRDGVIVNISTMPNRRRGPDRRKQTFADLVV